MPETTHAVKPSLSFAKLVANPTETAWSQAYNAGNLFACLSITIEAPVEELSLPTIGKESLNILESEFFTLEEKTSDSIKKAVSSSLAKIPPDVQANLTVASYKNDVLTVFIAGSGKVVMKRGEKIGVILEKNSAYIEDVISSASGYVTNDDTIILQTGAFARDITDATVSSALELNLPNDIVEALSPQVHEKDNGAQAAIIITYHGAPTHEVSREIAEHKIESDEPTIASLYEPEREEEFSDDREEKGKPRFAFQIPKLPHLTLHLSHKKKLYLTIAVILLFLLAASIFLAENKKSTQAQQALFQNVFNTAKQYYEEGQSLESLNQSLSHDNYLKAENKLKEADGKIAAGSVEEKQIQDLKNKVHMALTSGSNETNTTVKQTSSPANSLLTIVKTNNNSHGFGQNDKFVYSITDSDISSYSKDNGIKKELIKNEKTWSSPQAVVAYQGNIYVLDQIQGVIKFVVSPGGFSNQNYFGSTKPDLSKASGMAIDGSVWISLKDGSILKFTKGQNDNFHISGLDKPIQHPSKIYTNIDMESIYILDPGSNRIIQTDKKGSFKKAYASSVIRNAKEFDVRESEKRILILSDDKVYELPL